MLGPFKILGPFVKITKKTDPALARKFAVCALLFSIGEKDAKMNTILTEVKAAMIKWKNIVREIGISRAEQELMSGAFRY